MCAIATLTACMYIHTYHVHSPPSPAQFNTSIPEAKVCNELGIDMMDNLGGKIQVCSVCSVCVVCVVCEVCVKCV
jgi:hypothetical protein